MSTPVSAHFAPWFAAATSANGGVFWLALILAEAGIFVAPLALTALWVLGDHRDRRAAVQATLSGLLALAIAGFISSHVASPRPFVVGLAPNLLGHADDSSLPSDHATLLFALAAALWIGAGPGRRALAWVLGVAGLLVGASRVYLGAHYPSDIAAGALVGVVGAAILASPLGVRLAETLTRWGETLYDAPLRAWRRRAS